MLIKEAPLKASPLTTTPVEKQRVVAGACGFRVFQCYERENRAQ